MGILHGFDRLVFRGHLRQLSYPHGMDCCLSANRILLKDFKDHALERTQQLIDASLAEARRQNRPIVYLNSSSVSKEDLARRIAQQDPRRDGLIAVFKCVEPCWTFEVHRNRARQRLELRGKSGKCSFLYHYYLHPEFGLMHARIQTWFPYAMQVCLNGREWLARQMDRAGLAYVRRDNKFSDLEDFGQAQALLDRQVRTPWPEALEAITRMVHPAHPQLLGRLPVDYYGSVYQSEWASDIVFRTRADAERRFAPWVRHAMTNYRSSDVMGLLGRPVPARGQVHGRFAGEVVSTLRRREEGVCIKHWVNGNSIKMYDGDRVVRIETTINEPKEFKVYRASEAEPAGAKAWRTMRRGVADLPRRAEVSQASNERYAAATAALEQATPLKEVAEPWCRRVRAAGGGRQRKVRALNPLSADDAALLEAVKDPRYAVNGLRHRDRAASLYGKPARTKEEKRRGSARVGRLLGLLRAHGVIHKVAKRHRYQVSGEGRKAIGVLLAARNASAELLTRNAG